MVAEVAEAKSAKDYLEEWCKHIRTLDHGGALLTLQIEIDNAAENLISDIAAGRIPARLVAAELTRAAEANGLGDAAAYVYAQFHLDPPKRRPKLKVVGDAPAVTQDSIAALFAETRKGQLRYCHTAGAWFRWSGTHWRQDGARLAFNFVRDLARAATEKSPANEQKASRSAQFAAGVERFAQADPIFAVTGEIWDNDPWLLGTPDGTVDLRTGQLRPADPADGITRITAVGPAETDGCPTWLAFLYDVTGGDGGMIRFLQQWFGYNLTGDIREQSLVFAHGDGGNGKGTLLNTIAKILGGYAVNAAMDTFTASKYAKHSTDLAMLKPARMVTASETEEGHAWAESRIKNITGGDPITARFMRQNNFTYMPQFKLTIIGNHKPVLRNIDHAMRRRFNIVPFIRKPEKVDRELAEKLKLEWPAILRWMIDGCLDWQRHGLLRPQSVLDDTDAYFSEQDVFGQWISERCELSDFAQQSSSALYANWRDYAIGAGEDPGTQKAFSTRMEQRHFLKTRTKRGAVFVGIAIAQKVTGDGW